MPRTNGAYSLSGSNMEPLRSMDTLPWLERTGPHPSHQKVLLIDDDVDLCELLGESLRRQKFLVVAVHDGMTGLERALSNEFALIVLDLMLPALDGSEVLKRIRSCSNVPVIILTAKGEANDRIVGLEAGADDYVAKPVHPRELSARMRAVLRRAPTDETHRQDNRIQVGDIEINTRARTARRRNRLIDLTSVEFDLLVLFLKSPGYVLGREELTQAVLGRELRANDRSIDVHVSNVRRKLGPNSCGGERIKNVRSTGYLYVLLP
jgi:two-component system, OmpR family, response regulator CpxR